MSIRCIVATPRANALAVFLKGLAASGELTVAVVEDGASTLEAIKAADCGLVVVDEGLPDFESLALVVKVLMTNAMFNTAMITSMDAKEFEDKSEGYGVLCALPSEPDEEDGRKLSVQAARIMGNQ